MQKAGSNSPYLMDVVVGGLSELIHRKCLARGLARRKHLVSEPIILTGQVTLRAQVVSDPSFGLLERVQDSDFLFPVCHRVKQHGCR